LTVTHLRELHNALAVGNRHRVARGKLRREWGTSADEQWERDLQLALQSEYGIPIAPMRHSDYEDVLSGEATPHILSARN
jgi:hypothetical protein